MSSVSPALGLNGVLALRSQILERSQSLSAASVASPAQNSAQASGFGSAMSEALKAVNAMQSESTAKGAAWERGETHDIASVMLSRQKASIAFEATLQARNRLLSAYRDVMNMPV